MIKRRIWASVAVKGASLLSPWRGRHPHARRPDTFRLREKKRAVKLGGPHRPFDLPTEGGVFHRKVTKGSGLLHPPPGKSRRRGRLMPATPAISSTMILFNRIMVSSLCLSMISGQTLRVCPEGKPVSTKSRSRTLDAHPFARGSATKREDPPLLTRIKTLFLLSVRAALIASRTSPALVTLFPATSRITSPSLKPRSAAALFGSISVTTTPSLPAPATLLAGASVRPSFGTSVPLVAPPLSLLSVSALASTEFGNWPRVRVMTLSWPLWSTLSFTALPGARPPMVRASSRASLTVSPLTAALTSPASVPGSAGGPLAWGGAHHAAA